MSGVEFGRAAGDYASFRPAFAARLFERLRDLGVGLAGQLGLDVGAGAGLLGRGLAAGGGGGGGAGLDLGVLGAGTGLLGRGLAAAGVRVVESDLNLELLRQATAAERVVAAAEGLPFGDGVFDAVTAGQSWHWFDRRVTPREVRRVLKRGGRVAIVYQTYLPLEGNVAWASEGLILKYRPGWRHAGGVGINGQALKDLQAAGFVGIESFSFD